MSHTDQIGGRKVEALVWRCFGRKSFRVHVLILASRGAVTGAGTVRPASGGVLGFAQIRLAAPWGAFECCRVWLDQRRALSQHGDRFRNEKHHMHVCQMMAM